MNHFYMLQKINARKVTTLDQNGAKTKSQRCSSYPLCSFGQAVQHIIRGMFSYLCLKNKATLLLVQGNMKPKQSVTH